MSQNKVKSAITGLAVSLNHSVASNAKMSSLYWSCPKLCPALKHVLDEFLLLPGFFYCLKAAGFARVRESCGLSFKRS